MEPGTKDTYDFECIDCNHEFDVSDAEVISGDLCCPNCKSNDILDLGEED